MAKYTRVRDGEIERIAKRLIKTRFELRAVANSAVEIAYLKSNEPKKRNGRAVLGECERVPEKYKWIVPCDFMVTLFEPSLLGLSEGQVEAVVFHELLHVGVERAGRNLDGSPDERYFIAPHDVEDFEAILRERGLGWQNAADEGSDAADMAGEAAS